eukprot:Rmarinus@m.17215
MSEDIRSKPFRPPFWSSGVWGEPYGSWNQKSLPKSGKKRPGSPRRSQPMSPQRAHDSRVRADQVLSGLQLEKIEETIRYNVSIRKPGYETHKSLMRRGFRLVDRDGNNKVNIAQFQKVMEKFGISLTDLEVAGLFNEYGTDKHGELPYEIFVQRIFATQGGMGGFLKVKKNAFTLDNKSEWSFRGKIKYPECKEPVFPPTDWKAKDTIMRSGEKPRGVHLGLEFVYGYGGLTNTAPNVFYTHDGDVVYYTAAVGIVYNKGAHRQRFFMGHDDDIKCLAIDPTRKLAVTGQLGKYPYACVWETGSLKELACLRHPAVRGIVCCCFSADGEYVVTVGMDNYHTVYVWNWKKGVVVAEGKGQNGTPPQVFGVAWNPFKTRAFATYGVKHIKFWHLGEGSDLRNKAGTFGKAKIQDIMSVSFAPNGDTFTGTTNGDIYIWSGGACVQSMKAHVRDVRCLVLRANNKVLLSGGGDGKVISWDVSPWAENDQESMKSGFRKMDVIQLPGEFKNEPPVELRGLDCIPISNVFVAGTNKCSIWEVDETPEPLIQGHTADLYGVDFHPLDEDVFATACESEMLCIWSSADKKMLRSVDLDNKLRSVAYSPDGEFLAVGMADGSLKVVNEELEEVFNTRDCREAIDCVRFSPDGKYLAAGSHDNFVDIYDVKAKWKRTGRCKGHSSFITHIDWSADSTRLMSNCGSYEILHWLAPRGKLVSENQRDADWATWTCVLGFPVMGIWPDDSDGTDVNAVARSNSGNYLVTADDFGKVKLFNYPVVVERAPHRTYKGHSSHVMNVIFNKRDTLVISVGGRDRAVFQWRVLYDDQKLQIPNDWKHPEKAEVAIGVQQEKAVEAPAAAKRKDAPVSKSANFLRSGGDEVAYLKGQVRKLEGLLSEKDRKLASKNKQLAEKDEEIRKLKERLAHLM